MLVKSYKKVTREGLAAPADTGPVMLYPGDLGYEAALAQAEAPIMTWPLSPAYVRRLNELPPLSLQELAEQAIEFANTGSHRASVLLQVGVHPSGTALSAVARELADNTVKTRSARKSLIEREQLALQRDLAAFVEGEVTESMHEDWRKRASAPNLVLLPTFERDGTVRNRYVTLANFAVPPTPAIAYVLLQFASNEFKGKLCRCNLSSCGRFFLAGRPEPDRKGGRRGRTRRRYCSKSHRLAANAAGAAERMRRSREHSRAGVRSKKARRRL